MPLSDCCRDEAARSLSRHRDVATCDGCGSLLLAYGTREDFDHTVEELESKGADFDTGEQDDLRIVSKRR